MAKVPFSKLQASVNSEVSNITFITKTGEEMSYAIRHYLPIKEKLDLVSRIINYSVDDNNFYNPMRVRIYTVLEMVYAYTNLSFTDKVKEDPFKLYDMLISSEIFDNILNCIDEREWLEIKNSIYETIENIYKYRNSAVGIFEALTTNYSDLSEDLQNLQKQLIDPESFELVKSILSKLD